MMYDLRGVDWIEIFARRRKETYLSEIVEVVLLVHPTEALSLVEAVSLVHHVTDIGSLAVVEHSFEQL